MQYLLRPYSIEIERLLESLEKVTGYGGSLEASLFDTIADKLFAIRSQASEMQPEQALELWNVLYRSFVSLHENAADYIASLQTARAEEMMVAEACWRSFGRGGRIFSVGSLERGCRQVN